MLICVVGEASGVPACGEIITRLLAPRGWLASAALGAAMTHAHADPASTAS